MNKFDQCFQEGMRAAQQHFPDVPDCPHQDSDFAMWWERGYAYQARLFRAIEAEQKLEALNSSNLKTTAQ